jgi:AcrR family transcriptional regulator
LDALFSPRIDPLQRIVDYLQWLRNFQLERKHQHGIIPGSPLFLLGCELVARELEVAKKIRQILADELRYFEAAIREAVAREEVEPCEPLQQALCLRAAIKGIVSEARIMNDDALLDMLTRLPAALLRRQSGDPNDLRRRFHGP